MVTDNGRGHAVIRSMERGGKDIKTPILLGLIYLDCTLTVSGRASFYDGAHGSGGP